MSVFKYVPTMWTYTDFYVSGSWIVFSFFAIKAGSLLWFCGDCEWKAESERDRKPEQQEIDLDRWEERDAAKDTNRNSNSEVIGSLSQGWIKSEIHTQVADSVYCQTVPERRPFASNPLSLPPVSFLLFFLAIPPSLAFHVTCTLPAHCPPLSFVFIICLY